MANTTTKTREFFAIIQQIYTTFANSTKRWQVLKDNVKGLTPKSLSVTRWESRVDSVKSIRFQLSDVRESLLEVVDTEKDLVIEIQAKVLAKNEVGDFDFLVPIVKRYEVLTNVNLVRKKIKSKNVILDVAIKEVDKLIKYFKNYKELGFSKAIYEAK